MVSTKNTLIAERYSDALISIAEQGELTYDKICAELMLIRETLDQSKDLSEILVNPIVSIENKKEIIDKVFTGEINVLILNFLKVLIDKNRFDAFEDIFEFFNKSIDKINNLKRVQVTSAIEMSEELKNKLKSKLEAKLHASVIIEPDVNPEIIAGLVIKIEDNVIDMSLKHKLENLDKYIVR